MVDSVTGILDNDPIARKSLIIFYLIDTSGSMEGDKIGQVNTIMEEVLPEIRDVGGSDSDISMAVMTFDTDIQWMYDEPVSIEEIHWSRLTASGWTDFGAALNELDSKLSREGYMKSASLSFAPVIILLSDGYPNVGYESALLKIKNNNWFKYALKIAVAIGTDADKGILSEFTGNPETVVSVNNGAALRRMIRMITVTSSQIGSRSSSMDVNGPISPDDANALKEREFVKAVNESIRPEDLDCDDGW